MAELKKQTEFKLHKRDSVRFEENTCLLYTSGRKSLRSHQHHPSYAL